MKLSISTQEWYYIFWGWLGLILLGSLGCTFKKSEIGTSENPIKLYFIPSVDSRALETVAETTKAFLEKDTKLKFEVTVPQSYIAVIEALGTKKADVAVLNTHGYYLAHKKYGAEAKLMMLRSGNDKYQSQFLARADSSIKSISDLAGKKLAFVDPASGSGYLLPMKTLKSRNIAPKEIVFAMKHDAVIAMIYQRQVDAGATFYATPTKDEKGVEQIQDARRLVKTQFPDVLEKIKIIDLSDPIPNDPIIFRKEIPSELKERIVQGFINFVNTSEGKDAFTRIYSVNGLKATSDQEYEEVRKMFDAAEIEVKK